MTLDEIECILSNLIYQGKCIIDTAIIIVIVLSLYYSIFLKACIYNYEYGIHLQYILCTYEICIYMSIYAILIILIIYTYIGKIKGYLSHQKRFLVVSKMDPFPSTAVIKPMTTTNNK